MSLYFFEQLCVVLFILDTMYNQMLTYLKNTIARPYTQ